MAGLETFLVFERGIDLPEFAAFPLLDTAEGRAELTSYYEPYIDVARQHGAGFLLDTPTWRANSDWATKLGYDADELARVNGDAVRFVRGLGEASGLERWAISGAIGPRGDGYVVGEAMTADEAAAYHRPQIAAFAAAGADVASAVTMNYVDEAIGVALAAQDVGIPAVISFTTELDGRLPSGQELGEAIEAVDAAAPGAVAYFMVNCAHPTHFDAALTPGAPWLERIGGIRANASTKSHAELDEATELDPGDPADLGARYAALKDQLPGLTVLGGCCGTDSRHVAAIGDAVAPVAVV